MKRHKCAVCGKPLDGGQYHLVYDEQQRKSVKVCSDDRRCWSKFIKPMRKSS